MNKLTDSHLFDTNMEDLYKMQKELDAHIIEKKGLQGKDLLPNTVLALQVEIAEMANEWRGFKHWSEDQEPRGEQKVQCFDCHGERVISVLGDRLGVTEATCNKCDDEGLVTINPLLEEYVDCLHFLLSIANQLGLPDDDVYVPDDQLEGDTVFCLTELLTWSGKIAFEEDPEKRRFFFRGTNYIFLNLGHQHFGFEWEQIVEAYRAKHAENLRRQETGY